MRKKLKVIGLLLVVLTIPFVVWWATTADDESEAVAAEFFDHLQAGRHENAYALLTADLQEDVGSAEELARRWSATGVTRVESEFGCSGIGRTRHSLRLRPTKIVRTAEGDPLLLGELGATCLQRKCPNCTIHLTLHEVGDQVKIAAVKATF